MAKVVIKNLYKSFPKRDKKKSGTSSSGLNKEEKATQVNALSKINLTIEDGEFMVLVGPSGCGKSTLLRLIAGLEEITGGEIKVGDRKINSLPPKERDIAMVFQNYALYPHLSVYDNIAFGLRRMEQLQGDKETNRQSKKFPSWLEDGLVGITRKLPEKLRYVSAKEKRVAEQVEKVAELLRIGEEKSTDQQIGEVTELLQVDNELLDRFPKQLSGGQQQRVALGRAIARNPQVFLMDEPLSNLDAKLRVEIRRQIVKLQHKLGTTTIYVTHDQTEAMAMGDRIAVMKKGEIQQVAPPLDLYNCPKNRFVAEFIGSPPMNFLLVEVKAPLLVTHQQFHLTLPEEWEYYLTPYDKQRLDLGIRPEHLIISPPAPKNLHVQVDLVEALGHETYLAVHLVDAPNSSLQVRISPDQMIKVGDFLWLSIALDKIHLFDPQQGHNIALA